jgi:uncharacterized membrane protein YgcG
VRIVRLFGVLLTVLTAGLLLATPAGAQPPSQLTDHITDSTGVSTDSDRAAVNSAIDRLYRDRHIQLWVVYVRQLLQVRQLRAERMQLRAPFDRHQTTHWVRVDDSL